MTQIERLLGIMRRLRDPENGCPWDKEQTFATIAPYTLEETYEVLDAIAREDFDDLRGEQPLAFHFGIDGHLVERVHDIVLIVRGLRADREVAVVADDRLA